MSDKRKAAPVDVYLGWALTDAFVRVGRCVVDQCLPDARYAKTVPEMLLLLAPIAPKKDGAQES